MGRTVVALDLGSTGVRAAQFTLTKGAPKMTKVAFAALAPGSIVDGHVRDTEAVTAALKTLWAEHRFKSKQVLFCVANNDVLVRPADLDWMEPADFRRALPYQAEEHISVPDGETNIDFHAVREFEATDADGEPVRKVKTLLVMAAAPMVEAYVTAIRGAGLLPMRADLMPFALIRASRPAPAEEDTAEAVVEIGADVTTVLVHQGGTPRFVRIVAGKGGAGVTAALVTAFGWSTAEAERTKISLGLPSASAPAPAPVENIFTQFTLPTPAPATEQPAYCTINEAVSAVVNEVRTTLEFFLSSTADVTRISRVVLTGGGSLISGLVPRMSSELGMPVEHGTPLACVSTTEAAALPAEVSEQQMAAIVGMALGASR